MATGATVPFTARGEDWVLIDSMLDLVVQEAVVDARDSDVTTGLRLREMLAETIDPDALDRQYTVPLTVRQGIFLMYQIEYDSHFATLPPPEETQRLLTLRDALLAAF